MIQNKAMWIFAIFLQKYNFHRLGYIKAKYKTNKLLWQCQNKAVLI